MTMRYNRPADRGNKLGRDKGFRGSHYGAAGPVRHLRSKGATVAANGAFPATVTVGMRSDGTLDVEVFGSRAEANAAGFDWVGR